MIGEALTQQVLLDLIHGVARPRLDEEGTLGCLNFFFRRDRGFRIASSSTEQPGDRTMAAVTPSPKSACETPTTALSDTPGIASIAVSISSANVQLTGHCRSAELAPGGSTQEIAETVLSGLGDRPHDVLGHCCILSFLHQL